MLLWLESKLKAAGSLRVFLHPGAIPAERLGEKNGRTSPHLDGRRDATVERKGHGKDKRRETRQRGVRFLPHLAVSLFSRFH